jgi:hypothetical protein
MVKRRLLSVFIQDSELGKNKEENNHQIETYDNMNMAHASRLILLLCSKRLYPFFMSAKPPNIHSLLP